MPRPTAPPAPESVEIQSLYAFGNLTSNAGGTATYAGCFAVDGVLNIDHLKFSVRGRADLLAFKETDRAGEEARHRRAVDANTVLSEDRVVKVASEWQFVSRWARAAMDSAR